MRLASFLLCLLLASALEVSGQILKKAKKAGQRGVERTVEKRVEKEAARKTEKAMDEVFKDEKKADRKQQETEPSGENGTSPGKLPATKYPSLVNETQIDDTGKIIFEDDFGQTPVGDFPRKFVSSAGGEIVRTGESNGLKFYPNSNIMLLLDKLPENFLLSFDLTLQQVPPSLYNTYFNVYLQEQNKLKHNDPKNKFGAIGFSLWGDKKEHQMDIFNYKAAYEIKEKLPFDIPGEIIDMTSRWVILKQGDRIRFLINDKKVADSPNMLQGVEVQHINFRLNGTKKEEGHSFIISRIKVTETDQDLRSQLLEKGKFSTSRILFASGSDQLTSESFNLLSEIAAVMKGSMASFIITGHTDSDGEERANLVLSQQRAESVKKYLVAQGIGADRLQTDGKGESEPVAANDTPDGKAQNRRVEFVKK